MAADHILDPRGEVILVVRNPNAPLAQLINEELVSAKAPVPAAENTESCAERPTKRPKVSSETSNASTHPKPEDPNPKEIRIQVSAKHLSVGSPVFDRMLYGGWKEGKEFKEKGSIELEVDNCDIEALLVVLYILHSRLHQVPHKLNVEQLAKIAVVADYYDCQSLAFFSPIWLGGLKGEQVPAAFSRDLVVWIWVSFYFRWGDTFENATRKCIECCPGPISSFGLPIPKSIIDAMNKNRCMTVGEVISMIYEARRCLLEEFPSPILSTSYPLVLGMLMHYMQKHALPLTQPGLPYNGITCKEIEKVYHGWQQHLSDMRKSGRQEHWCEKCTNVAYFVLDDFLEPIDGLMLFHYTTTSAQPLD